MYNDGGDGDSARERACFVMTVVMVRYDGDADSAGSDNEGERCVIQSIESSLDDENDSDDSGE